jgi:hypothetical protein
VNAWQSFALLELMKQISREDPELWQRIMQFSNERVFRRTKQQSDSREEKWTNQ